MYRLIIYIVALWIVSGCRIYNKESIPVEVALNYDIEWIKLTTVDGNKYECYNIELKNDTIYAYKPTYWEVITYKIPSRDIVNIQVINSNKTGAFSATVDFMWCVHFWSGF